MVEEAVPWLTAEGNIICHAEAYRLAHQADYLFLHALLTLNK